jgi:large subunit ribosomal protein L32
MAVPKKKTSKSKTRSRRASAWKLNRRLAACAPAVATPSCPTWCARQLRLVRDRVAVDVG